jgi:hypothetical protein
VGRLRHGLRKEYCRRLYYPRPLAAFARVLPIIFGSTSLPCPCHAPRRTATRHRPNVDWGRCWPWDSIMHNLIPLTHPSRTEFPTLASPVSSRVDASSDEGGRFLVSRNQNFKRSPRVFALKPRRRAHLTRPSSAGDEGWQGANRSLRRRLVASDLCI